MTGSGTEYEPIARLKALACEMSALGAAYRVEELRILAEDFIGRLETFAEASLPEDDFRPALEGLKKSRLFGELAETAELLARLGFATPFVRTLHAQALIELRQISAAIGMLEAVIADTPKGDADRLEAFGLLGRAYKQLYVDEARTPRVHWAGDHLARSLQYYALGYLDSRPDRTIWHAINLAALLKRAARDGYALDPPASAHVFAEALICQLEPIAAARAAGVSDYDQWIPGVLGGAYLTLDRFEDAARWYGVYAQQPGIDAFKLIGTVRQLEEVHEIGVGSERAGQILTGLKAAALKLTGGHATFTASAGRALAVLSPDKGLLESVIGRNAPMEIPWLQSGLDRARSVATVYARRRDEPFGTGFLVRGADLWSDLGDEVFLLTCHHVLSDPPHARARVPAAAYVAFDIGDSQMRYHLGEIIWCSNTENLDAALVRLKQPLPDLPTLAIAPDDAIPTGFQNEHQSDDAYVIGRPEGQKLSVSLHDTDLIDAGYKHTGRRDQVFLHYTTPTKPGNSGSPVFQHRNWLVIGLHHMGAPSRGGSRRLHGKEGFNPPANEGISLSSIRAQIRNDRPGRH
jgi:hypothetical protein